MIRGSTIVALAERQITVSRTSGESAVDLSPRDKIGGDRDPCLPTPWRRLPADLATAMRPRLPATVQAVADAVTECDAGLRRRSRTPSSSADVRTAVQVALERFLDLVGTDEPALPPRVREVFVALGAAEAREDRGPEALLAALRMASRLMLRMASRVARPGAPGGHRGAASTCPTRSARTSTSWPRRAPTASPCSCASRPARATAGAGSSASCCCAAAPRRASSPPRRPASAGAALDAVVPVLLPLDQARDARFRYGADGVVVERGRDAVLLLRAGPRATRAQLAEALAGPRRRGGSGAGLGPGAGGGPAGRADRRARRAPSPGPVFADDHLAALALRGEPGALAVLSARRLAPLAHAARRRSGRACWRPCDSWLRHWGSRAAVVGELFVHPQTVSYRLGRLRELLGDDLDDPTARFELLLVLAAMHPLRK